MKKFLFLFLILPSIVFSNDYVKLSELEKQEIHLIVAIEHRESYGVFITMLNKKDENKSIDESNAKVSINGNLIGVDQNMRNQFIAL